MVSTLTLQPRGPGFSPLPYWEKLKLSFMFFCFMIFLERNASDKNVQNCPLNFSITFERSPIVVKLLVLVDLKAFYGQNR